MHKTTIQNVLQPETIDVPRGLFPGEMLVQRSDQTIPDSTINLIINPAKPSRMPRNYSGPSKIPRIITRIPIYCGKACMVYLVIE